MNKTEIRKLAEKFFTDAHGVDAEPQSACCPKGHRMEYITGTLDENEESCGIGLFWCQQCNGYYRGDDAGVRIKEVP